MKDLDHMFKSYNWFNWGSSGNWGSSSLGDTCAFQFDLLMVATSCLRAPSYPAFQYLCSHASGVCAAFCSGEIVMEASSKLRSICSLTSGLHCSYIAAGNLVGIGHRCSFFGSHQVILITTTSHY